MPDIWDRYAAKVRETSPARLEARSKAVKLERRIRRPRSKQSNWTCARQVLNDIEKLVHHRHKGPCTTDDGEDYLTAALPSLVERAGGFGAERFLEDARTWARAHVPRVTEDAILACVGDAKIRNERKQLFWVAQALGNLVCLTTQERERLHIKTLRPAGMTKRAFVTYQKARKATQAKARRIANGARPREQSAAQLAPWLALGISRATFHRRKKKGALPSQMRDRKLWERETGLSPLGAEHLQHETGSSQTASSSVPGPARPASDRRSRRADGPSPGATTRAFEASPNRAPPLPRDEEFERGDPATSDSGWVQLGEPVLAYESGVLPPNLVRAVREAQQVRAISQAALAQRIGVSRSQLTNALGGRFGLSRGAAINLVGWLVTEKPRS